jgi:hypothetical protein
MITTGSVRGKCFALHAAQSRCHPPSAGALTAPQFAQYL